MRHVWVVVAMIGCLAACDEAAPAGAGGGSSSSTGTGAGGAGSTSTSSNGSSSTSASSSGSASGGVIVINEISAAGADWVEIANAGDAVVDLSDVGVCDSDAAGMCKIADVVRFPMGTSLGPGQYLLILGNMTPTNGPGPYSDCAMLAPSCYYAAWKVSASNGEKVHVIDGMDQPITEVDYPANAVPDGQTWSRLPDLTGNFGPGAPTPAAANKAAP